MRWLATDDAQPNAPGSSSSHEARRRALTVSTRAVVVAVANAAAAVAATFGFPLGQITRHCLLPPASSTRDRRRAVTRLRRVVFREGQV